MTKAPRSMAATTIKSNIVFISWGVVPRENLRIYDARRTDSPTYLAVSYRVRQTMPLILRSSQLGQVAGF